MVGKIAEDLLRALAESGSPFFRSPAEVAEMRRQYEAQLRAYEAQEAVARRGREQAAARQPPPSDIIEGEFTVVDVKALPTPRSP